jgi:hypothetical protein
MRRGAIRNAVWWLIPLCAWLVDLGFVLFVQPAQPLRDENVFYPAAQAFARAGAFPGLEFIRHYPAPQAPLGLYLAGRLLLLSPRLVTLRLANGLLMGGALLCFSLFAWRRFGQNALLATTLIALNPYFHLVATHFYTDALYFSLVVLIVTRAPGASSWLALALAPLTRQFGVIFAFGEALQALVERQLRPAALALLALLPLAALFLVWHGFAPATPRASIVTSVHSVYGWFFPYVAAYHVAALGCYLLPLTWRISHSRSYWACAVLFGLLYLVAPAHQNFSAELAGSGVETLGLVHRVALLFGPRLSHAALFGLACLGGGLVGEALASPSAAGFSVAAFVLLSAFNFQAWDKYLLDVLPTLLVALCSRSTLTPR